MMLSVKGEQMSEEWTLKVKSWGHHLDLKESESHQINYMICCLFDYLNQSQIIICTISPEKLSAKDITVADKSTE